MTLKVEHFALYQLLFSEGEGKEISDRHTNSRKKKDLTLKKTNGKEHGRKHRTAEGRATRAVQHKLSNAQERASKAIPGDI